MLHINTVLASLMTAVLSLAFISSPAAAAEMTASDAIAPLAGTAVITWSKPMENTDGSPLTNLAGYLVFYGVGFPVPYAVVFVGADATELQIENLWPGDWYFMIESVNTAGITSQPSPTIVSTMQ